MIRCAVVGLGRIGSLLEDDALREKPCTHAGAIAENPDCVLVGGADIDPERRLLFSRRWDCPAVFADAEDLLRETQADILHIATHPDSHLRYALLAAKHRVPVVVCEKPLADSLAAAGRIAGLHRRGAVKVVVNHERRYSADYRLAKSRVDDGHYGKLLSAAARLYFGRRRRLADQMIHDGTHMADIIAFLAGGRLRKTAVDGRLDRGTGTAFISAKCGGVPVFIEVGAGRDHLVFELDLSFESGRVRIGNGIYEEYESRESPYYEGFRSLVRTGAAAPEKTGYFTGMLRDAAACVRDPRREPESSAADGYAALKFILSTSKKS
jgi:predicted dehydrogenase